MDYTDTYDYKQSVEQILNKDFESWLSKKNKTFQKMAKDSEQQIKGIDYIIDGITIDTKYHLYDSMIIVLEDKTNRYNWTDHGISDEVWWAFVSNNVIVSFDHKSLIKAREELIPIRTFITKSDHPTKSYFYTYEQMIPYIKKTYRHVLFDHSFCKKSYL